MVIAFWEDYWRTGLGFERELVIRGLLPESRLTLEISNSCIEFWVEENLFPNPPCLLLVWFLLDMFNGNPGALEFWLLLELLTFGFPVWLLLCCDWLKELLLLELFEMLLLFVLFRNVLLLLLDDLLLFELLNVTLLLWLLLGNTLL